MDSTALSLIDDFPFAGESRAAWEALQSWKRRLLDMAVDNPAETLLLFVGGAAVVFYLAEKDVNDDVETYGDALHYISTCLSVGYARIFPQTQVGKLIATIVMTFGPSVTAWVVEGRLVARGTAAPQANNSALIERLDAILVELRAQRGA